MPYDPLHDPAASNYLATIAAQGNPVIAQQSAPPRKRVSGLEALGQIGDAISRMYGHPGVYQTGIDEQAKREYEEQRRQTQLQQDQDSLSNTAIERMARASAVLEPLYKRGGAGAAIAGWDKLAPIIGMAPEKAAQFRQLLTENPEMALQHIREMVPQQAQGSLPAEIQNYKFRQSLPEEERQVFDEVMIAKQQAAADATMERTRYTTGAAVTRQERQLAAAERRQQRALDAAEYRRTHPVARPGSAGGMKMPAAQQAAYLGNNDSLRQIAAAKKMVENRKESVGAKFIVMPDAVAQRVDPDGVAARAAVSNIGSLIIHDRSGATVTVAESPRLRPFIPSAGDTPAAIGRKLDNLSKILSDNNRDIESFYSTQPVSGGSSPPPSAVDYLRRNPNLRQQFDAKYGTGAAAKALGR